LEKRDRVRETETDRQRQRERLVYLVESRTMQLPRKVMLDKGRTGSGKATKFGFNSKSKEISLLGDF
jgi:hypothetical protein